MKNIHVLPTDKPSKLFHYTERPDKFFLDLKRERIPVSTVIYKNICITSEEEIKKRDWCLDTLNDILFISDGNLNLHRRTDKKIILTTDQDLIKDGVQAIDDEFLEWFVKNPSCEEVEVISFEKYQEFSGEIGYEIIIPKEEPKKIFDLPIATNLGNALTETMKSVSQHEAIIIPKEEPKLTNTINRNELGIPKGTLTELIGVPKQETLEEAAEIFFNKRAKEEGFDNWTQIIVEQEWEFIESFPIEFAKWQAERMYSEEEKELMIKIFHSYWFENNPEHEDNLKELELSKKLFEQFKKK